MKRNTTTVLGLALATALTLGMTGCGSDDAADVVDALSGGTGTVNTGGTAGTTQNLDGYGYIFIYKNVSDAFIQSISAGIESYEGYSTQEVSSSTTCTDYGFSNGTDYSEYTYYVSADYSRFCTEYNYSGYSYAEGNKNVVVYYNN